MTWIGVDLDGTLAKSGAWPDGVGEPIPAMMERVKYWLSDGKTVKIFSARANDPGQVFIVREWLAKHGLRHLELTATKDYEMSQLWDDSAVQVVRDTGYTPAEISARDTKVGA